MEVIHRAVGIVGEYEKVFEAPQDVKGAAEGETNWKALAIGYYKVNTDVAKLGEGKMGLGAVMRDHLGEIMAATRCQVEGAYETDIAEAMAVRHGLLITIEAGLRKVVVETDNLKLAQQLRRSIKENTAFGCIVKDVLQFAKLCTDISFAHVRREGNKVAHCLAKLSKSFSDMRVWIEEFPLEATELVNSDALLL
ncbi:hypothetical protein RDABS01_028361 [Bienertia sinuspersici]